MDIEKNIKDIRAKKGLLQKDVAERMGIENSNYNRFEKRGDKLTIEQLKQIAAALGVTMKDILFGQSNNPNTELSKLELALSMERNATLQHKNQKIYYLDNVLKFILNIGSFLHKETRIVNFAVGEILSPQRNEYRTFVRLYCNFGQEVFTLATWQKTITKEEAYFAHSGQNGEILFDDVKDKKGQKKASQLRDVAFSDIQENPDCWKINFINLTTFFEEVFRGNTNI